MATTQFRGHTRIRGQALEQLAQAITCEAMHIDFDKVTTALHDRETKLEIEAHTPVNATVIERCRNSAGTSVYAETKQVRRRIAERFTVLSGMQVAGVTLILTGISRAAEEKNRRVR